MKRIACCLVGVLLWPLAAKTLAADIPAVVGWAQRVELGTLVSGVVSEVHVRPGQQVSEGDRLLSLDKRGFSSQVSRRAAEHRHAQAVLEEAQREDERAIELYDRTVLSDFERNQALVAARLDLERSVIQAPFDGAVLAVNAARGQSVVSELQSQPLVVVADTRRLRARALVDAAQADRLKPGGSLDATLRGASVKAAVGHLGFEPVSKGDQGTRYELFVDLVADPERPLRVGETVILHLP